MLKRNTFWDRVVRLKKDERLKMLGESIFPVKNVYRNYKSKRTRRRSNVSKFRMDDGGAYEE